MFELDETGNSSDQDRGTVTEEVEQQEVENSPPQMNILKLSTNGSHQLQTQECPVQVVQQPLQYPAYLAPVYNAPGQILMNKNVAFHSANINQPLQFIAEGKAFPSQVPPMLIQGKPIVQGFPRFATIPTSEYNQAVVISPMEAGPSLHSTGNDQQKEPPSLSKMIITKSRPDTAIMVTGWDQSNILNTPSSSVSKSDVMGPQIMSPVQCQYEMQSKSVTESPLSQSPVDWKASGTSQDLKWLPGAGPSSSPIEGESNQSTVNSSESDLSPKMHSTSSKKSRSKKCDGTAFPEVTSTIDEHNESETSAKAYQTDFQSQKSDSPILEKSESQTTDSSTICSEITTTPTKRTASLNYSEPDSNMSLPILKPLNLLKDDTSEPEELERQYEPALQFKTEETQTSELWQEDSSSLASDESFEESENSEMKKNYELGEEEDADDEDEMAVEPETINPQDSPETDEDDVMEGPSGSLSPTVMSQASGSKQNYAELRQKNKKFRSKKVLNALTKVINISKPKKVSIFRGGYRTWPYSSRPADRKRSLMKKDENTRDREDKWLGSNSDNAESRQFAQDESERVDPTNWTVNQVCDFIRSLPCCSRYADNFALHDVDGKAMMLLDTKHLMSMMSMKLGPAVKLMARIKAMRASSGNNSKTDG